jgi:organic radical activating enzyme
MFGNNPIRPPLPGDGQELEVQEIFKTIQGEGPLVGTPSIFIRLGGCNLACAFCDTEFESFTTISLDAILEKTKELAGNTHRLIVITGGEPFRQPITALCNALIKEGFQVQIETNGTLYREIPSEVHVICSPKNQGQGYFAIRDDLLQRINAFKFIISETDPLYQGVSEVGQSQYDIPVYVQPMDSIDTSQNKKNIDYTVALAQKHGYLLSLQTHKILGIA